MNTGTSVPRSEHNLLSTVGFKLGPDSDVHYALEGSIASAGAAVKWLRDNLGIIKTASETETLASQVPDSGGMFFVPAFNGLLAPYWRSDARAVACGMSMYTNKSHFCRAVLESVCFQTRE
eukprot:272880_1